MEVGFEREYLHMKLDELYGRVSDAIASLDFARIWPGFSPLRFALYDDEACFFAGTYIEKPDAFCANTSISYHGETIAIWKVEGELDISVLTAKIVQEMFHGCQVQQGWDCWADEMDALYRYDYSAGNLALRLRENELLLTLLSRFDSAALRELPPIGNIAAGNTPTSSPTKAKSRRSKAARRTWNGWYCSSWMSAPQPP